MFNINHPASINLKKRFVICTVQYSHLHIIHHQIVYYFKQSLLYTILPDVSYHSLVNSSHLHKLCHHIHLYNM